MRRSLAVSLVILVALVVALQAQSQFLVYEQILVGSSPKTLSATTIQPANREQIAACLMRVESVSVRYRIDGPAATSTVGMPASSGIEPISLTLLAAQNLSLHGYQSSSTTALVNVTCWR